MEVERGKNDERSEVPKGNSEGGVLEVASSVQLERSGSDTGTNMQAREKMLTQT